MMNLRRFFHFHHGDARDQTIKMIGSFVAAVSLAVLGASLSAESAFLERSYILSMLVPELAIVQAGVEDTEVAAVLEATPVQAEPQVAPERQVCLFEGKKMPCDQLPPESSPPQQSGPSHEEEKICWLENRQIPCEQMEAEQERQNRKNVLEEQKNTLREIRDQKRELKSMCSKLKRLKGAESNAVSCNELIVKLTEIEQQIKSPVGDVEEAREQMNEFRDMRIWDEINSMRLRADLPRELNQFFKDLLRVERMLKQKSFQKIVGLNFEQIAAKFAEIKQLHAESKACYESGDFECANEKLNEARQDNYPGELEGSLHMLRSINDMLRNIRDQELQGEVQQFLMSAIEQLNGGEWREANQEINGMQQELMQVLEQIMRSQSRRSGPSAAIMNRLETLMQKYGGNGGGGDEEEFGGGPPEKFPMMKQF